MPWNKETKPILWHIDGWCLGKKQDYLLSKNIMNTMLELSDIEKSNVFLSHGKKTKQNCYKSLTTLGVRERLWWTGNTDFRCNVLLSVHPKQFIRSVGSHIQRIVYYDLLNNKQIIPAKSYFLKLRHLNATLNKNSFSLANRKRYHSLW